MPAFCAVLCMLLADGLDDSDAAPLSRAKRSGLDVKYLLGCKIWNQFMIADGYSSDTELVEETEESLFLVVA